MTSPHEDPETARSFQAVDIAEDRKRFTFDGVMIRRHSDGGAYPLDRNVAARLLPLFEADGPWAEQLAADLRQAIHDHDAAWAQQLEAAE